MALGKAAAEMQMDVFVAFLGENLKNLAVRVKSLDKKVEKTLVSRLLSQSKERIEKGKEDE